ncbi:MAG: hypothetical protein ABI114_15225 [Rhodanobacter sp.]
MKKLTIVCMLVALASPSLYAQTAPPSQPSPRAPPVQRDIQSNIYGSQLDKFAEVADESRRDHQAKMVKLRAKLAKDWQALGMSSDAAEQLAATYQPKGRAAAHRVSLQGKSNGEIAAMLQAALAQKDYMLANETLIEFERKKVRDSASASADD